MLKIDVVDTRPTAAGGCKFSSPVRLVTIYNCTVPCRKDEPFSSVLGPITGSGGTAGAPGATPFAPDVLGLPPPPLSAACILKEM